jgi:uncharacterized protein (DUF1330 family)
MITFSEHDVEQMAAYDPDAPVVMVNLLRFAPNGGQQIYMRYLSDNAAVWERYGVQPLYAGTGQTALVAEAGQEWDAVAIVRYPSRRAFLEMIRDPEYLANEHLRTDSLVESVLQPTTPLAL